MKYWSMKLEPEVCSITDLQQEKETIWNGVRNYRARKFIQEMNMGDLAFFYHFNATPSGIAELIRVVKT